MIRRFEWVDKKDLPRKNIDLTFNRNQQDKVTSIDIDLDLEELDVPSEGKIHVEAYYRAEYERFSLGKVSEFNGPKELELDNVGYSESTKVRVMITRENHSLARLATGITPSSSPGRDSIMPVAPRDLGQELWKVDFDEDPPLLKINEKIDGIQGIATSDPMFIMSVYPSVMRQILNRIIFVEDIDDPEDYSSPWQQEWLIFARNCHQDNRIPESLDSEGDEGDRYELLQWIDDAVEGFTENLGGEWRNLKQEVESQ